MSRILALSEELKMICAQLSEMIEQQDIEAASTLVDRRLILLDELNKQIKNNPEYKKEINPLVQELLCTEKKLIKEIEEQKNALGKQIAKLNRAVKAKRTYIKASKE